MEEIWKDVPYYEGVYQVSSLGSVKKLEHTMSWKTKTGKNATRTFPAVTRKLQKAYNKEYLAICFPDGTNYTIHRLVAIVFIPNPNGLDFVNHIDGNKHNNNVTNLEWCTRQQNETHAFRTGLKNSTGVNNTMAKLKDNDVKTIKFCDDRSFKNKLALSAEYNVNRVTIERIWNNKIWKHI